MVYLIINADDLGKNHQTNLSIEDAFRIKCITSSTIMANTSTWDDVHRIVNNNPLASFGVHLNLTEGRALTNNSVLREYGVVDDNNCFTKVSREIASVNQPLSEAIFKEWDSQINEIINVEGISVTHIDGHHHIHMNTAYTSILKSLAEKYHIKWIRRIHNSWRPLSNKEKIKELAATAILSNPFLKRPFMQLSKGVKSRALTNEWFASLSPIVHMTDYFNGYEQACDFLCKGYFPNDTSTIELMCHPGHDSFLNEYKKVQSHEIENIINNVVLCSYKTI